MTERLIVIGGGGAGISAATTAKRVNPDLKVSLYTEFEDIAYSPCGIPFVYGGEIPRFEDLFLSTVERYVSDGLDMRMETVGHRPRPRPRDHHRAQPARGLRQADRRHRLRVGEARRAGRQPRGPALRQEHPQGDGVRQGARDGQDRRRGRRHAARRRDGRQPRPARPGGPLHRRGPVGAARGARPRRRRARPRVADQARRDAAPGDRASRASWATTTCARWPPRRARSPATWSSSACTRCPTRRSPRPPGWRPGRPAG